MATNERVENTFQGVPFQQEAAAFTNRTDFTPGKAPTGKSNEANAENWPKDFEVKTGVSAIDNGGGIDYTRVFKIDRATMCDQTIPAPTVEDTEIR